MLTYIWELICKYHWTGFKAQLSSHSLQFPYLFQFHVCVSNFNSSLLYRAISFLPRVMYSYRQEKLSLKVKHRIFSDNCIFDRVINNTKIYSCTVHRHCCFYNNGLHEFLKCQVMYRYIMYRVYTRNKLLCSQIEPGSKRIVVA